MALIIEDGSIVANAEAYVDAAFVIAYAAKRQLAIPADVADIEAMICLATDYLESRRFDYQGDKTDLSQSLQYPRTGSLRDCKETIDPNTIPKELKNAQAQLVVEQHAGVPLFPSPVSSSSGTVGQTTKIQIGPLVKEYSDKSASTTVNVTDPQKGIVIATVETLLRPLFEAGCKGSSWITTCRV